MIIETFLNDIGINKIMISPEGQKIITEIKNPSSWHWKTMKTKDSTFKKILRKTKQSLSLESLHVVEYIRRLEKEGKHEELDFINKELSRLEKKFIEQGEEEAAIGVKQAIIGIQQIGDKTKKKEFQDFFIKYLKKKVAVCYYGEEKESDPERKKREKRNSRRIKRKIKFLIKSNSPIYSEFNTIKQLFSFIENKSNSEKSEKYKMAFSDFFYAGSIYKQYPMRDVYEFRDFLTKTVPLGIDKLNSYIRFIKSFYNMEYWPDQKGIDKEFLDVYNFTKDFSLCKLNFVLFSDIKANGKTIIYNRIFDSYFIFKSEYDRAYFNEIYNLEVSRYKSYLFDKYGSTRLFEISDIMKQNTFISDIYNESEITFFDRIILYENRRIHYAILEKFTADKGLAIYFKSFFDICDEKAKNYKNISENEMKLISEYGFKEIEYLKKEYNSNSWRGFISLVCSKWIDKSKKEKKEYVITYIGSHLFRLLGNPYENKKLKYNFDFDIFNDNEVEKEDWILKLKNNSDIYLFSEQLKRLSRLFSRDIKENLRIGIFLYFPSVEKFKDFLDSWEKSDFDFSSYINEFNESVKIEDLLVGACYAYGKESEGSEVFRYWIDLAITYEIMFKSYNFFIPLDFLKDNLIHLSPNFELSHYGLISMLSGSKYHDNKTLCKNNNNYVLSKKNEFQELLNEKISLKEKSDSKLKSEEEKDAFKKILIFFIDNEKYEIRRNGVDVLTAYLHRMKNELLKINGEILLWIHSHLNKEVEIEQKRFFELIKNIDYEIMSACTIFEENLEYNIGPYIFDLIELEIHNKGKIKLLIELYNSFNEEKYWLKEFLKNKGLIVFIKSLNTLKPISIKYLKYIEEKIGKKEFLNIFESIIEFLIKDKYGIRKLKNIVDELIHLKQISENIESGYTNIRLFNDSYNYDEIINKISVPLGLKYGHFVNEVLGTSYSKKNIVNNLMKKFIFKSDERIWNKVPYKLLSEITLSIINGSLLFHGTTNENVELATRNEQGIKMMHKIYAGSYLIDNWEYVSKNDTDCVVLISNIFFPLLRMKSKDESSGLLRAMGSIGNNEDMFPVRIPGAFCYELDTHVNQSFIHYKEYASEFYKFFVRQDEKIKSVVIKITKIYEAKRYPDEKIFELLDFYLRSVYMSHYSTRKRGRYLKRKKAVEILFNSSLSIADKASTYILISEQMQEYEGMFNKDLSNVEDIVLLVTKNIKKIYNSKVREMYVKMKKKKEMDKYRKRWNYVNEDLIKIKQIKKILYPGDDLADSRNTTLEILRKMIKVRRKIIEKIFHRVIKKHHEAFELFSDLRLGVAIVGSITREELTFNSDIDFLFIVDDRNLNVDINWNAEIKKELGKITQEIGKVLIEDLKFTYHQVDFGKMNEGEEGILFFSEINNLRMDNKGKSKIEPTAIFDMESVTDSTGKKIVDEFRTEFLKNIGNVKIDVYNNLKRDTLKYYNSTSADRPGFKTGLSQLLAGDSVKNFKFNLSRYLTFLVFTLCIKHFDISLPINMLDRISWLHEKGILSKDEKNLCKSAFMDFARWRIRTELFESVKMEFDSSYLNTDEINSLHEEVFILNKLKDRM